MRHDKKRYGSGIITFGGRKPGSPRKSITRGRRIKTGGRQGVKK